MKFLRIGHKKAFGGWKLIWEDKNNITHIEPISGKLATTLMAQGMNYEG